MEYAGGIDDVCAISLLPASQLKRPVGFDSKHAFECESVIQWLTRCRATHPLTGQVFAPQPVASLLHPLAVNGCIEHLAETQRMLNNAGHVIGSVSLV